MRELSWDDALFISVCPLRGRREYIANVRKQCKTVFSPDGPSVSDEREREREREGGTIAITVIYTRDRCVKQHCTLMCASRIHVLRCLDCLLRICNKDLPCLAQRLFTVDGNTRHGARYRAPVDALEINTPISRINSARSIIHARRNGGTVNDPTSDRPTLRRYVFLRTPREACVLNNV